MHLCHLKPVQPPAETTTNRCLPNGGIKAAANRSPPAWTWNHRQSCYVFRGFQYRWRPLCWFIIDKRIKAVGLVTESAMAVSSRSSAMSTTVYGKSVVLLVASPSSRYIYAVLFEELLAQASSRCLAMHMKNTHAHTPAIQHRCSQTVLRLNQAGR